MLAEISDKMLGVPGFLAIGVAVGLLSAFLGWLRWWLVLTPMPVLGYLSYGFLSQLSEPDFGRMILSELGWGYVTASTSALNAPYLLVLAYFCIRAARRRGVNST